MCKKLVYLFLLMAVFAGSAQAQFITSIAHRNTDSDAPEDPEIAPNPLDEDELTFVDRTHQYNEIPAYLIGAQYIMTANDNKNVSAYELDERFRRLGVPRRIGSETVEEARSEVDVALGLVRK